MPFHETGLVVTVVLTIFGWIVASYVSYRLIRHTDRQRRREDHLRELKERIIKPLYENLKGARSRLPYGWRYLPPSVFLENDRGRREYLLGATRLAKFEDSLDLLLYADLTNHFKKAKKELETLEAYLRETLPEIRKKEIQIMQVGRDFVKSQGWTDNRIYDALCTVLLFDVVGREEEVPDEHRELTEANPTIMEALPSLRDDPRLKLSEGIPEAYETAGKKVAEVERTYAAILPSRSPLSGGCSYS